MLDLPRDSQHAKIIQRVGITDITINYHRPLVKGRKVWGGLVPYGQVWRAGANENTTIEFTDPVTVEGKQLARGIYGLHMLPTENEWTVIFSKAATAWGSFTYNQLEDALRVTVKSQTAEMKKPWLMKWMMSPQTRQSSRYAGKKLRCHSRWRSTPMRSSPRTCIRNCAGWRNTRGTDGTMRLLIS
ncbi:MAG TPA: DUF2911 domain-containing protein [Candidatus Angelobacter sp.]